MAFNCYYDVLEPGEAFLSPFRTFVFSDRKTKLNSAGFDYESISEILRLINCEKLFGNYHEMMVSEKLITDTLKENGYKVTRITNLGGCRGDRRTTTRKKTA